MSEEKQTKKNNSKTILLILLILFLPAGLIYYLIKRKDIRNAKESVWFFNHPFISYFIFIGVIITLITITAVVENNRLAGLTPEERAEEEFKTKKTTIEKDIKTMVGLDGVKNDDVILVSKIDGNLDNLSTCIGTNPLMSIIQVDITDETQGTIDEMINDDFSAGIYVAKKTYKRIYTDSAVNKEYLENIGMSVLSFVKTPAPTIDAYGNEVKQAPVNLGYMALCHQRAIQINWDNMDNEKLANLVVYEWQGTKGTSLKEDVDRLKDSIKTTNEEQIMADYINSINN